MFPRSGNRGTGSTACAYFGQCVIELRTVIYVAHILGCWTVIYFTNKKTASVYNCYVNRVRKIIRSPGIQSINNNNRLLFKFNYKPQYMEQDNIRSIKNIFLTFFLFLLKDQHSSNVITKLYRSTKLSMILSRDIVNIDGVWIGNWIYWTLTTRIYN
jgi:hypothetical protein